MLLKYKGVCPVTRKNFEWDAAVNEVLCLRAAALYGGHVLKNKKISFSWGCCLLKMRRVSVFQCQWQCLVWYLRGSSWKGICDCVHRSRHVPKVLCEFGDGGQVALLPSWPCFWNMWSAVTNPEPEITYFQDVPEMSDGGDSSEELPFKCWVFQFY